MDRTSLYRKAVLQKCRDKVATEKLKRAHEENPFYGVRRLAIVLGWNKKKVRRIRNLAGVKAYVSRRSRRRTSGAIEIPAPDNILRSYWLFRNEENPRKGYTFVNLTMPDARVWVQDFTYISWHGKMYYLAAILNVATRKVMGWAFSRSHDADMVCDALFDALMRNTAPKILHSDRGSEYLSTQHQSLCKEYGITMSASEGGSPWQNGFMERFFSTFKSEMKERIRSYRSMEERYEQIAIWINYYNSKRIHTALSMSPNDYEKYLKESRLTSDKVLQKKGA